MCKPGDGVWLVVQEIQDGAGAAQLVNSGLHAGEAEAVVLASELTSEALLMDDQDGIRAANASGATVIRTPGVYRLATQKGIIPSVRPKLDDLRRSRFWLRDDHYRKILESLGE